MRFSNNILILYIFNINKKIYLGTCGPEEINNLKITKQWETQFIRFFKNKYFILFLF